jgi:hypothetical protein
MNIKKTLTTALIISFLTVFAMTSLIFTARAYLRDENKYFERHFRPFTHSLNTNAIT